MQAKKTQSTSNQDALLEGARGDFVGWRQPAQRLREALAKDELQLYVQPIMALPENRFAMAEVLVRLREEEAKLLPPGDFLPTFEHYGMMAELDRWVVRRIVQRLACHGHGGFRRYSINVAGQTLKRADLPGFVLQILEKLKVRADTLCFEIDESDMLAQLTVATRFAVAVRSLGCKVAIDGFGRRATSFAPLKTLRVDYIKVDGSITRNILRSAHALRKLQTILRAGDAMHAGIVAEFVEQADILDSLRKLGVGYAQGFGIARPAPIEDLPKGG